MGLTVAVRNAILDAEYSVSRYLALSTADPTADGSGLSEPSGGSYARVEIAAADWGNAAAGVITTVNDVTCPAPTGDWGRITHVALCDAATEGNVRASCQLPISKVVSNGGDAPVFYAGNISVTLT